MALYRGYILSFAFMVLSFANKYIARMTTALPQHILLSSRFALAFLFLLPLFLRSKAQSIMTTKRPRLQIFRSILVCSVIFLTYIGYTSLPLGIASSISASEPIFVAIWSVLFGYETIMSLRTLFPIVLLGIAGIFLISSTSISAMVEVNRGHTLGILSLLLANILCSGGHYVSATLGQSDKSETTLLYNILFVNGFMLAMNTILGIIGHGFDFNLIQPYASKLVLLGLFAASGSWLGLEVFRHIDPNTHVSIQNLSLPFAIIISRFVEHETISFRRFIGIAAIFASTWLLSYRKFNIHDGELKPEIKQKLKRYTIVTYAAVSIMLCASWFIITKPTHVAHHHDCCCC